MHQFAPGSPAIHTNDNLTDDDAEWYLKKYPHIVSLFMEDNEEDENREPEPGTKVEPIIKKTINNVVGPIGSVKSSASIGEIILNQSVKSSDLIGEINKQ